MVKNCPSPQRTEKPTRATYSDSKKLRIYLHVAIEEQLTTMTTARTHRERKSLVNTRREIVPFALFSSARTGYWLFQAQSPIQLGKSMFKSRIVCKLKTYIKCTLSPISHGAIKSVVILQSIVKHWTCMIVFQRCEYEFRGALNTAQLVEINQNKKSTRMHAN